MRHIRYEPSMRPKSKLLHQYYDINYKLINSVANYLSCSKVENYAIFYREFQ